ncbi:MAG: helix-turn-helix transcriptional regulator [Candidatus Nitrosotenuis sp.]
MKTQEAVLCSIQDFPDVEGMLFVRITDILNRMLKAPLIAIGIILAVIAPAQQSLGAVRMLDFTVYPDGTTHISQESSADPQDPELTVSLFGTTVDNFVAQDENGVLLSYDVTKTKATIQTFGAASVSIDYDTYDLVSKKGKIWTFAIDTSVDYTLNMPEETVIVGMTNFPELVETVDNRQRLSLPKGENEIDYFFGISGPAQSALKAIDDAKVLIGQANNDGVKTTLAQGKLDLAISEYDSKKYTDAEQLAFEAQESARAEMDKAANSPSPSDDPLNWFNQNVLGIATSLAAIGGAISAVTLILKKTRSAVKKTIEPLLNKNSGDFEPEEIEADEAETPEMREDDKRLVAFLEQNGGQAFERDLRKKFLLPRTTMWRAVKRLERQGIIVIEKKEFQNLVKLKKKPEEVQ